MSIADASASTREAYADAPSQVFHCAPVSARAAIEREGLRASSPARGTWGDNAAGQPAGIYVSLQPDLIGMWTREREWDVWRVDAIGLALEPDGLNDGCFRIDGNVPASRLTHVMRVNDEQAIDHAKQMRERGVDALQLSSRARAAALRIACPACKARMAAASVRAAPTTRGETGDTAQRHGGAQNKAGETSE